MKNLTVSGEASTAEEALELAHKRAFDLVILDIVMPGRGGIEILRDLRAINPNIRIIVLSMYIEKQLVLRCYREGADAYVNKRDADDLLISAIETVLSGRRFVSQRESEIMVDYLSNGGAAIPHDTLTQREMQVLVLIGEGWSTQKIAAELSLGVKTVYTYRNRMMTKMGFHSTAEMVKYALDHKLLSLP